MKVLMTERFLPESIYSLELGNELKKYCELTIFCKRNVNPVLYPGLTWINRFYRDGQKKWLALPDYWLTLQALTREIRRGGYDVVHVQTFKSAKHEMDVYMKNRKYYGKLVHTVHNILPHEVSVLDRKLYGDFYHACDELIVHNEVTKKRLAGDFHIEEEKITVIPHGAYNTHMGASKKTVRTETKNFVVFGNIRRYKGIDILLEALALVPSEVRKRIKIVIAGKQFEKLDDTDYEGMIHGKKLDDCVSFQEGFVPEEKMDALFQNADAAIFPYREIYASGAMLMAYTYKVPVIASDIPVFREETNQGKTGRLFSCENIQELAKALSEAADWSSEVTASFQKEIDSLIQEKYNWEKSAKKTSEVYRKNRKNKKIY